MTDTCTILLPYVKIEDPHLCTDSHALLTVRRLLFPGLLRSDGHSSRGILAEKWEQENAGRTWRFYIKKGITFQNGHELTADDVVYSLKRAASPEVGGQLFTVTYNEYFGNARITAMDRYTVLFENPEPIADLEDFLTDLAILPAGWKSYSDGTGPGPYRLVEYDTESARLEIRSGFSRKPGIPEKLLFLAEADPYKRTATVRKGEAQLALDPPINEIDTLGEDPGATVFGWDTSLSVIFFIDCRRPPLDDIRIRRALNLAVDVDALIRDVIHGHGYPLNGPFSSRHFAFDPGIEAYPHDPEAAQELLKEAGLTGDFTLEVHAPTSIPDEGPALAEFVTASLQRVGIKALTRLHEDRTEYARKIAENELQGIYCFDSSPLSSYKVLHEKLDSRYAGTWWQGFHNDKLNKLISRATETCNRTERQQIYREAYRILHEDPPWVFLYQPRRFWISGSSSGIVQDSFDDLGFFNI